MDVKDYESSRFHTIVFMDGEQGEENEGIPKVEYQHVEVPDENIDDVVDIKEENVTECGEELVIDGALEGYQAEGNLEEIKYAECATQEQWCQEVPNGNTENIQDGEEDNVEYYAIPTTIDGQYFAVPNHVMKEEGVTLEQPGDVDGCYQMSSVVDGENGVLVHENIDGSNIQYFEMPQIIQNNDDNLITEEHLQTPSTENYEEPTIIVHLGNNLTIDEKGQIHSSASEYFPVEENGGDVEQIDPSEVEFYSEAADDLCGDQMVMDEHDNSNNEGEQFDDEPQKGGEIFILSTIEELEALLQEYCQRTSSQFVGSSKSKNFGSPSSECVLTGHQISWCDIQSKDRSMDSIIKFDGVPYMIVGTNILHCQFGTNKSAADRERRKAKRAERGIDVTNHDLKYPTKKCGCPAKVNIKQIIRFPEFKIEKDTGWKRRDCAAKLRQKLSESRESVVMEMRFVGRLPDVSEHKYHESLQDLVYTKELVLQDLVVKAQNLWLEGKTNLEIFNLIRHHVINEMFWKREPPDVKMKRYYPTKKDIRNYITRVYHMCHLRDAQKESIKAIINEALVEECGANVSFDISERSLSENNDSDTSDEDAAKTEGNEEGKLKKKEIVDKKVETFLFCFQTPTQQRLLKKYNNVIFVVEIEPFKPPKRVLTYCMYAILVQTNIDYQVVGLMVVSKLRKDGLQEGLVLFREWNAFWNPKYFLVDCSELIYNAVTNVFPDAVYFLNPHSCENKWLEFMKTPSNDLEQHTDELIKHLKNMQYSLTEESLSVAALVFEQSQVWQNSEKFRTWFQTKWLPIAKYWVMGYRPEDLLILQHIKSSIDCCINVYREALYQSAKYDGFIELLKSVTTIFPKLEYQKYMTKSNEAYWYYKHYSSKIGCANYMQGVPISIIPYVLDVCELAQKHEFTVNSEQMGVFNVEYQPSISGGVMENDLQMETARTNEGNKIPTTVFDENLGIYIISDDKVSDDVNGISNLKEVNIKETLFGWIECSKAMEPGEHTVSFGDMTSYPFCTCSHWMLYRLPCVHMFVVFIKVPGWRYDMMSPLYRYSAVLHIDCSCVINSQLPAGTDVACQSDQFNSSVATQTQIVDTSIFESATNFKTPDLILSQAKEFFLIIKKNAFLFRNKMLHSQLCCQLDKLVSKLYSESAKNKPYQFCLDELGLKNNPSSVDNRKPLKICSLNLQQIKKFSDSNVSFQYVTKSQVAPKMGDTISTNSNRTSNIFLNNKSISKKGPVKSPGNVTNTFLVKTLDNALNSHLSKGELLSNVSTSTSRVTINKINDLGFGMPSSSYSNPVDLGASNTTNPTIIVTSTSSDPVNVISSSNSLPMNIATLSDSNPVNIISSYLNSVNMITSNNQDSANASSNIALTTVLNLLNGSSNTVAINSDSSTLGMPPLAVVGTTTPNPAAFLSTVKTEDLKADIPPQDLNADIPPETTTTCELDLNSSSSVVLSSATTQETAVSSEPSLLTHVDVPLIEETTKTNLKRGEASSLLVENAAKRKKASNTETPKQKVVDKNVNLASYSSQNKGKYTLRRKLSSDDA